MRAEMIVTFRALLLIAGGLVIAAAPGLAAQDRDPTLAARMDAFLDEVAEAPNDSLAAFFPRRGGWSWVQTIGDARGGPTRPGVWRFGPTETVRAIGEGGPACDVFHTGGGEYGPVSGTLGAHVRAHGSGWRRVPGNRFVQPGAPAASPAFVEWRIEDGRWVISAVGDEGFYAPRVLGTPISMISRDTSLVPEGAPYTEHAVNHAWYVENLPISLDHRRYVKYDRPRRYTEEDRTQLVRIGRLGRVPVYTHREMDLELPEYLFLPVAPGEFQLYQGSGPEPCR